MRRDVRKVLFIGVNGKRQEFFQKAQEKGWVQFIDPKPTFKKEVPANIACISQAIKVLRGYSLDEQKEFFSLEDALPLAEKIVTLHERTEQIQEELRVLRQEEARVGVFGDFSWQELRELEQESGRKVRFFASKHRTEDEEPNHKDLIYVGAEHGLTYYMALMKDGEPLEGMIEMRVEESVGDIRRKRALLQGELRKIEGTLRDHAAYHDEFHVALGDHLNHHNLKEAVGGVETLENDQIFAVQGWVAETHFDHLKTLTKELEVHFEEIAIEPDDQIPTYLENEGYSRIGEDLVHIYDTPAVTDKDPSPWVLWSFALFFAMILSDGGYGVIFLVMSLVLGWKFPDATGAGKRVIKLTRILALSCIGWGIFSNSFFGLSFAPDSLVMQYSGVQRLVEMKADYHLSLRDGVYSSWVEKYPSLANASNWSDFLYGVQQEKNGAAVYPMRDKFYDNIMLELALFVGVAHITLSLLRTILGNWAGLGWIAFMAGGYLYFPIYLNATSMMHFAGGLDKAFCEANGVLLIQGGIGAAVVLALIQHRLGGAGEIVNIIQVFADVLSYLRLYALGLAGSMMSSTFNEIGMSMTFVAGMIVILIGHVVNIVLSIMGGVIHGLRLNFLEWYHYCFEGGGKLFKPLKMIKLK